MFEKSYVYQFVPMSCECNNFALVCECVKVLMCEPLHALYVGFDPYHEIIKKVYSDPCI